MYNNAIFEPYKKYIISMIFPCYFFREVNIQVTIFAGFAEVQAAQSTKNLKWLCGYLLLLVKKQESTEKKTLVEKELGCETQNKRQRRTKVCL